MKITDIPSPNFNERKDGKKPYILVLHYTETNATQDAINLLLDPTWNSGHYVIGDDGDITRMVPEDMRAWHAGKSFWAGESDINSVSIGIEIQNPGYPRGYLEYPMQQMESVRDLCLDIIKRHDIKPWHVLGHSDVAVGRKIDPGHLFPWSWLADQGVGLWRKDTKETDGDLFALLHAYGYDPNIEAKELIAAFQRHYEPEVFIGEDRSGQATEKTLGIIHSLLAQKSALV